MSQPLVSIVIPAFNRGGCLADALASLQAQTWTNWEVIVVDDGSSDSTIEIVESVRARDARIRLVRHDANRGAQAARNTGIDHAGGEWVAFLDSDDLWLPDSLEVRMKAASEKKVAVVHSGAQARGSDGEIRPYPVPPIEGPAYRTLLQGEGPLYQALLVAKQALRRIGGLDPDIVAFQEWDTSLSLAKHFDFAFVPQPTFVYDLRRTDTISKNKLRGAIGFEQVFHKRYGDVLWHCGPGTLASHYRTAAAWYAAAGAKRAVARCEAMGMLWSCVDVRSAGRRVRYALSRFA